ncbi:MAG: flagellar basal body L-ring protein FlgH [Planctomyces sp.]|nr:flagellar basal body L-ring protein FlgH [Planctomyces sp.]
MIRSRSLVCGALMLAPLTAVHAESLWQRRSRDRAYLFYDAPIYEVGDHLTVLIREQTGVANREARKLKKASKLAEAFSFAGTSGGGFGAQGANASLNIANDASRQFDGEAAFSSEQGFTDQLRVTVTEVLPNGNLVIAGDRRIDTDGDLRTLVFSGTVRPQDIGADGAIPSNLIANQIMSYQGAGTNQRFLKQGWFSRGLNKLWPF